MQCWSPVNKSFSDKWGNYMMKQTKRSVFSDVAYDLRAASDHSVDNSTAMLQEWLRGVQHLYHSVEWRPAEQPRWISVFIILMDHIFNRVLVNLTSSNLLILNYPVPLSVFQLLWRWTGSQTLAWLSVHPCDEVKAGSTQSCQASLDWLHIGETGKDHEAERIKYLTTLSLIYSLSLSLWTVTTCWQTVRCYQTW